MTVDKCLQCLGSERLDDAALCVFKIKINSINYQWNECSFSVIVITVRYEIAVIYSKPLDTLILVELR